LNILEEEMKEKYEPKEINGVVVDDMMSYGRFNGGKRKKSA